MIKNKKGQVSVEMIVVIGFLILLAVLLAALFLGFFRQTTESGGDIDTKQTEVVKDYFDHIRSPQTGSMDAITDTYLPDQEVICGGLPYIEYEGNYLCIYPLENETAQWGCRTQEVGDLAKSTTDGKSNTDAIVAFHDDVSNFGGNNFYDCTSGSGGTCETWGCSEWNNGTVAAKVCDNLNYGGFDDWYLPALHQMQAIWNVGSGTNATMNANINKGNYSDTWENIVASWYWLSSEHNVARANFIHMFHGNSTHFGKTVNTNVRCVRDHN